MISKHFTQVRGRPVAQVTFSFPAECWVDTIHLVGTFNQWDRSSHPLRQNQAGQWTITVDLELGETYQFRYLCDGCHWTTEFPSDGYITDSEGLENFVVVTSQPETLPLSPTKPAEGDSTTLPQWQVA